MATTDILGRCKAIPERQYGTRFKGLLLYGSVARDQADSASDVDLLVLLSGQFDYFDELRRIIDVLYPLQLDSDRLISAKPVSLVEFEQGRYQLYRNAEREGVLV